MHWNQLMKAGLGAVLAGLLLTTSHADEPALPSNVSPDEEIILFPTSAVLNEEGSAWSIPVHGWIFEPETNDPFRRVVLNRLIDTLDRSTNSPDDEALAICEKRIQQFIVDNERAKRIVVRVGDEKFALDKSGTDGHFRGEISVATDKAAKLATNGWITFEVIMPDRDERKFRGSAQLVSPEGVLVISDIDDTVKITEVTEKGKLIENTFFRGFKAVDGMAAAYRQWGRQGVAFAFVSGSPWQLYGPLSEFLTKEEFPAAAFHLKSFSLKDPSVAGALADPDGHKLQEIGEILARYPKRRVVLIGDSGERDPEIYGRVARESRDRIARIFIRRVTSDDASSMRYKRAFEAVPKKLWSLFDNATELPASLE